MIRAIPYYSGIRSGAFLQAFLLAPLVAQRITRKALQERTGLTQEDDSPDGYFALDPKEWEAAEPLLRKILEDGFEPEMRYVAAFYKTLIHRRTGGPTMFP